jgi:hypothetical protein
MVKEFTANCDDSDFDWINQHVQHSEVEIDRETWINQQVQHLEVEIDRET